MIEWQQLQEWRALANAATEPATPTITGDVSMGFDIDIPCGIRNSFAYKTDAEFHSQAQGVVLALLDEVARLQAELDNLKTLATAARGHRYTGLCPDETQPDTYDAECALCQLLIAAQGKEMPIYAYER